MSTSRAISPRASRLSSRPVILAALLLASCASASLFGETTEILATGPDRGTGIPYLQPNVISFYAVTYRTASQEGGLPHPSQGGADAGVRVLFTKTAVVPYSAWKPAPCGSLRALRIRESPPVLYYRSAQGWSLFFAFSASNTAPCSFVSAFVERFDYFLGVTQNSAISSFPAVLRVP